MFFVSKEIEFCFMCFILKMKPQRNISNIIFITSNRDGQYTCYYGNRHLYVTTAKPHLFDAVNDIMSHIHTKSFYRFRYYYSKPLKHFLQVVFAKYDASTDSYINVYQGSLQNFYQYLF